MKKQPNQTAITKQNIINSFWKLYKVKSIEKITIKEIVSDAGYNRSTFYEYFVDIYDLLSQLEDSLIEYIKENISNSFSNEEDIINQIANVYESRGEYISVLFNKNGNTDFSNKLKKAIRPVILQEFKIKKENPSTSLILEFAISAILSSISYWYSCGKVISAQEVVIMIRSMLTNGVTKEINRYSN